MIHDIIYDIIRMISYTNNDIMYDIIMAVISVCSDIISTYHTITPVISYQNASDYGSDISMY